MSSFVDLPAIRSFQDRLNEPRSINEFWETVHNGLGALVPHGSLTPNVIGPKMNLYGIKTYGGSISQRRLNEVLPVLDKLLLSESPFASQLKRGIASFNFERISDCPAQIVRRFKKGMLYNDIYVPIETSHQTLATVVSSPKTGHLILSLDRPDKDFTDQEQNILRMVLPAIRWRYEYYLKKHLEEKFVASENLKNVLREEMAPLWFDEDGNLAGKIPVGTQNVLDLVLGEDQRLQLEFLEGLRLSVCRQRGSFEGGAKIGRIKSIVDPLLVLHYCVQPCPEGKAFRVAYLWLRDASDRKFPVREFRIGPFEPLEEPKKSRLYTLRFFFALVVGDSNDKIAKKLGLTKDDFKLHWVRIDRALGGRNPRLYDELPLSFDAPVRKELVV